MTARSWWLASTDAPALLDAAERGGVARPALVRAALACARVAAGPAHTETHQTLAAIEAWTQGHHVDLARLTDRDAQDLRYGHEANALDAYGVTDAADEFELAALYARYEATGALANAALAPATAYDAAELADGAPYTVAAVAVAAHAAVVCAALAVARRALADSAVDALMRAVGREANRRLAAVVRAHVPWALVAGAASPLR